jgi:hypothetical protein
MGRRIMTREGINRREVLRGLASGVAATVSVLWVDRLRALAEEQAMHMRAVPAGLSQARAFTPTTLSAHQYATVGTLVELIIPTTETPGAKAAQVDRYIDTVLAAAEQPDRNQFLAGLSWLDGRSRALFGKEFVTATTAQQTDLLTRISAESAREERAGIEFFTAIKTMTIAGYYSTEIGLRQELGDDGRLMLAAFEGCTHPEHQ